MTYTVNKYNNLVYEILNFITEEEQSFLLDIIKNTSEKDWPLEVDNEFQKNDEGLSGKNLPLFNYDMEKIFVIDKKIEDLFENNGRINQLAAIQRYKPGVGMGSHTDNGLDETVLYGLVVYINDDYEGGEIYYLDLDLKIKPKARSIIIHPAGLEHEVLEVKGTKTRYILSSFIRGDSTTKFLYSGE
jgi:hypothetical protein